MVSGAGEDSGTREWGGRAARQSPTTLPWTPGLPATPLSRLRLPVIERHAEKRVLGFQIMCPLIFSSHDIC